MKISKLAAFTFSFFFFVVMLAGCTLPIIGGNIPQNPEDNDPVANFIYTIVGTNLSKFFDNFTEINQPNSGEPFYGQDANYEKIQPSYTDNGDETITDNNTGLMWQKNYTKTTWSNAQSVADSANTGGYTDWRIPTIKELYSLIDFTGSVGSGGPDQSVAPPDAVPFINTEYFNFDYADTGRYIDVQYLSNTEYTSDAMNNPNIVFGVNFADGHIKGYPTQTKVFPLLLVRGNTDYGTNDFVDNGDGTITDKNTGLMWLKYDSGYADFSDERTGYTKTDGSMNWEEALDFCENLAFAGYSDWRLPDAKELHSIVDYSRSPDYTQSAAIDPIFEITQIIDEMNKLDYPAFWSSTTFNNRTNEAIIICFGEAIGYLHGTFLDVHGAGCQRTDSKTGIPSYGDPAPQGDVMRIYNYVRPVRTVSQ